MKDASAGVLRDLRRFQKEKEEDLQRYMVRKHLALFSILVLVPPILVSHFLTGDFTVGPSRLPMPGVI